MRAWTLASLAVAAVSTVPLHATADRKIFGFTYPYMTLPKGAREIEYYLDVGILPDANLAPDLATAAPVTGVRAAFAHQLEFEYGITDRLDLGLYNVAEQNWAALSDEPLRY